MNKRFWIFIGFLLLGPYCAPRALADDLFGDARSYFSSGKYRSAVIQLKNLLRENPKNGEARLLLGKSYIKLKDGESAIKELTRAKEYGVSSELWSLPLANAYLLAGKQRELLEEIRPEQVASNTVRAGILANRAMAELALRNTDEAEKNIAKALELDPDSVEVLTNAARFSGSRKEFAKAAEYARKALELDDNDSDAWMVMGEVNRGLGENRAAIENFNKAQALAPDFLPARLSRVMARISLRDFDAAEKDLDQIDEIAENLPMALYLRGLIDFERKSYRDAENSLNKVISVIPDHWPSLLLLGTIAYHNNQLETAFTHLKRYLSGIPDDLSAIKLFADTQRKLHRNSEAIELLERVREKVPDDYQVLALLGSAYLDRGNFDKAAELLSKAAELAPDSAEIRAQLALSHLGTGSFEQASGELETAIELQTDLSQADVLFVLTLIRQKNYDAAINAASRLATKLPDNPVPENLLGLAYFRKGDEYSAIEHWKKSLEIPRGFIVGATNLAKIEISHKDYAAAARWYEQILEHDSENIDALLSLVELAEIRKNEPDQKKWMDRALTTNPDDVGKRLRLVDFLMSHGDLAGARNLIDKLNKHHPDNLNVEVKYGVIHLALEDVEPALSTFRKLVGKHPDNPELRYWLAQSALQEGSEFTAKIEWERTLELKPDYLPALAALIGVAVRQNDYEGAIRRARQFQSHAPKQALGYQLEGDVLRAKKDYVAALTIYRKGYAIEPSSGLVEGIFLVSRATGDRADAYRWMVDWLDQHPEDLKSQMALAAAYFEDGEHSKAIPVYEKLLEKQPGNVTVLNNLAWLYQEAGDSRALETAERALASGTRDVSVIDTVGWILMLNGRIKESLDLLHKAAQEAPRISTVQMHYAQALIKAGRNTEAREQLRKLLSQHRDFPEKQDAENLLKSI